MDVSSLLAPLKLHARLDTGTAEDAGLTLMLTAAAYDVCHAAAVAVPAAASSLPADLRFAVLDQAARLYDARGADTPPPGLTPAAARIAYRYRGVSLGEDDDDAA